jgi:hypothetical protein
MSDLSKSFVVGGLGQGIELLTLGHVLSRIATAQQAQLPNASFFRTVGNLCVSSRDAWATLQCPLALSRGTHTQLIHAVAYSPPWRAVQGSGSGKKIIVRPPP